MQHRIYCNVQLLSGRQEVTLGEMQNESMSGNQEAHTLQGWEYVTETLCKLIAYNITVLISAMYELKIEPSLIQ